jgi:hypothetical protein
MVHEWLLKHGCKTRVLQIKTVLNAQNSQNLGSQLQTNVGLIFGLSVYADGIDFANQTLITSNQAYSLFLNLVHGDKEIIQQFRLVDLLNQVNGSPLDRSAKYTEFIIKAEDLQLDISQYLNPLLIGGAASLATPAVVLNLWYINRYDRMMLQNNGILLEIDRLSEKPTHKHGWTSFYTGATHHDPDDRK